MERNVDGTDESARVVQGVALGIGSMAVVAWGDRLGTANQILLAAFALLLAAIMLATAGAETCPINAAVGRDTYRGGRKRVRQPRDGQPDERPAPGRSFTPRS